MEWLLIFLVAMLVEIAIYACVFPKSYQWRKGSEGGIQPEDAGMVCIRPPREEQKANPQERAAEGTEGRR